MNIINNNHVELLDESIYTNPNVVKAIPRELDPKQTEEVFFILSNTKTRVGKIIKKVLDVEYNHISFSFEDNFNEVYGFGFNSDENEVGFIIERFDAGRYRDNNAEYITLGMKVTPNEKRTLRKTLENYKKNRSKYKFNKVGLVSNAFGLSFNPDDAFFCSQFVAKLFKDSGIQLFNKSQGLTRPSDFLFHPNIIEKHKGLIKDRLEYEKAEKIRKQKFFK